MEVLVIGSGGREHALAWKIAQSPSVEQVYVAPGNAGTAGEDGVENLELDVLDFDALRDFASRQGVDLTLVGPEAPLAQGIVEYFQQRDLAVFGPTRAAAKLEWSKEFSKAFMRRHGIPTADFGVFDAESAALPYLETCKLPVVVKADGLAAGKGVVVADTRAQAIDAARGMLSGADFGDAGRRIVVEEFLRGEEASFICMVDGEHVLPLATSQDYKTRDEGDRGPNTGGMGAYSPAPVLDDALQRRVLDEVMQPAVDGLRQEGAPFVGFLYAGLMIDGAGRPSVLEFNCRLGDPEAQPILMRLRSDLVELCRLALAGRLDGACAEWDERTALGVVMAAGGYPAAYEKGEVITGLDAVGDDAVKVFHAGTRMRGDEVVTAGGRVLCVTVLADTVAGAQSGAYRACGEISWPGAFCRRDIGHRAIGR